MLAGVVGDLQHVEGDPVDAGLAQRVQTGDVRTAVVDLNLEQDFCVIFVQVIILKHRRKSHMRLRTIKIISTISASLLYSHKCLVRLIFNELL